MSHFFKLILLYVLLQEMYCGKSNETKDYLITLGGSDKGKWVFGLAKKDPAFPHFPFCGITLNTQRHYSPYECSLKRGPGNQPHKFTCTGGKMLWERSNGIEFIGCFFHVWAAQTRKDLYGSYWYPYHKMCPNNYWISGFQFKQYPEDGISGLIIHCTYVPDPRHQKSYLVKDGRGIWSKKITLDSNYASSFDVQMTDDGRWGKYITGLQFRMMPWPRPTEMKFKYPPTWVKSPIRDVLASATYTNPDKTKNKTVLFNPMAFTNRRKTWKYHLVNTRNQYQGVNFNTFLIPKRAITIQIPFLETDLDTASVSAGMNRVGIQDYQVQQPFYFNKWMYRTIPPEKPHSFTLGPCEKLEVQEVTDYGYDNFPYTMFLLFTSADTSYLRQMRGTYIGYINSKPQLFVKSSSVC